MADAPNRPRSLRAVLAEWVVDLERDLLELLASSSIGERETPRSRGLIVLTPRPFEWGPLPGSARPLQRKLERDFAAFRSLLGAVVGPLLQRQQDAIDKHTCRVWEPILQVDNSGSLAVESHQKAAVGSLHWFIRFLDERFGNVESDSLLIPDTNALYAKPDLDDWQFEGIARFTLIIVPAVHNELDEHQRGHRTEGVREKARRLIRQFGEYRRRGRFVDGVVLRSGRSRIRGWGVEPRVRDVLGWLDPDVVDDRILASAIEIAQAHALAPTAVVTRDGGLLDKCELARIPYLSPPE